ncbi:MAG: hypothetical protein MR430_06200 [Lachnospiraceae bacterium]|nr:hypothetical protein [Lachnospiraceae bacterium]
MKKRIAKFLCLAVVLTGGSWGTTVYAEPAHLQAAGLKENDRQELNFNTNWLFLIRLRRRLKRLAMMSPTQRRFPCPTPWENMMCFILMSQSGRR